MKLGIVSFILLVALGPQAIAADPEDLANDISNEVMSPFCPGVTLHDCPSDTALELRREIERWAASGMERAEIMAELEAQYGPEIRATPQAHGRGLFAWLFPLGGVLLASAAGVVLSKRWASDTRPTSPAGVPASLDERARLERELSGLRDGT